MLQGAVPLRTVGQWERFCVKPLATGRDATETVAIAMVVSAVVVEGTVVALTVIEDPPISGEVAVVASTRLAPHARSRGRRRRGSGAGIRRCALLETLERRRRTLRFV